ncbi:MAG: hypothetical protein SFU25_11410 [Candidatus Caenarcaniphilales bacterium]|nr:hypothetical protein [Candidatus Caenarcaniphilales bacterium]
MKVASAFNSTPQRASSPFSFFRSLSNLKQLSKTAKQNKPEIYDQGISVKAFRDGELREIAGKTSRDVALEIEEIIASRRIPFLLTSVDDNDAVESLKGLIALIAVKQSAELGLPIYVVLPPEEEVPFQIKKEVLALIEETKTHFSNISFLRLDSKGDLLDSNMSGLFNNFQNVGISFFAADFPKSIHAHEQFMRNVLAEHQRQNISAALHPIYVDIDHHSKTAASSRRAIVEQVLGALYATNRAGLVTSIIYNSNESASAALGLVNLMNCMNLPQASLEPLDGFLRNFPLATITDLTFHHKKFLDQWIKDPNTSLDDSFQKAIKNIVILGMKEFAGLQSVKQGEDIDGFIRTCAYECLEKMKERVSDLEEGDRFAKAYIALLSDEELLSEYRDRILKMDQSVWQKEKFTSSFNGFEQGLTEELTAQIENAPLIASNEEGEEETKVALCFVNPSETRFIKNLVKSVETLPVRNMRQIMRDLLDRLFANKQSGYILICPIQESRGNTKYIVTSNGSDKTYAKLKDIIDRLNQSSIQGDIMLKENSFGAGMVTLTKEQMAEIIKN